MNITLTTHAVVEKVFLHVHCVWIKALARLVVCLSFLVFALASKQIHASLLLVFLQSNQFGLVHRYHPTTHHPSQRLPAKIRLFNDFVLPAGAISLQCLNRGASSEQRRHICCNDQGLRSVTVHLCDGPVSIQKAFVVMHPPRRSWQVTQHVANSVCVHA